jgi:hypothetical protein
MKTILRRVARRVTDGDALPQNCGDEKTRGYRSQLET